MSIFYLLGIRFLNFLIAFASLFNQKAKYWINGRKNLFSKLQKEIDSDARIAWFHCASLGEFEQGRSVIEAFKLKYPDFKILLTFYSPSGYEIRKNYEQADYIYYLPIDTPKNAKRFLEIVNPKMVFFIKYEFWYYFLREINKRSIPLYLVSGIFRKEQSFFKKYGRNFRKMLNFFTHFFVQNEESQKLLQSINLTNVTITGDTRFDRVYEIAQQAINLDLVQKFKSDSLTIVAGSTWKPDEELIIRYINKNSNKVKLIIAPHEIHKENINRLINAFNENTSVIKYSEVNEDNIIKANVLIIDSIGLLSSLYKYGDVAYIGGGFGKGIHNTLEAATFGLPIIFGPNYLKFQEAVDLIQHKSAFSIKSYENLEKTLNDLFSNKQKINAIGQTAYNYVEQKRGATKRILSKIHI